MLSNSLGDLCFGLSSLGCDKSQRHFSRQMTENKCYNYVSIMI